MNRGRDYDHSDYPAHAWPGGYPIMYATNAGDTLCPEDAKRLRKGSPFVHWEGPPAVCDECGREVESAYGDPAARAAASLEADIAADAAEYGDGMVEVAGVLYDAETGEEAEPIPTCDVCGEAQEDGEEGEDWNGDTGCHRSCEPRYSPSISGPWRSDSDPAYRSSMIDAGRGHLLR